MIHGKKDSLLLLAGKYIRLTMFIFMVFVSIHYACLMNLRVSQRDLLFARTILLFVF